MFSIFPVQGFIYLLFNDSLSPRWWYQCQAQSSLLRLLNESIRGYPWVPAEASRNRWQHSSELMMQSIAPPAILARIWRRQEFSPGRHTYYKTFSFMYIRASIPHLQRRSVSALENERSVEGDTLITRVPRDRYSALHFTNFEWYADHWILLQLCEFEFKRLYNSDLEVFQISSSSAFKTKKWFFLPRNWHKLSCVW